MRLALSSFDFAVDIVWRLNIFYSSAEVVGVFSVVVRGFMLVARYDPEVFVSDVICVRLC
jgi:hypothetical protein